MNEIIDVGMMAMLDGMAENAFEISGSFVSVAKILAATFCIIYFSIEGYKMLVLESRVQIMPLLKPIVLSFIVMGWGSFISIIDVPLKEIQQTGRKAINVQLQNIEDIHAEHVLQLDSIVFLVEQAGTNVEMQINNNDGEAMDKAGIDKGFFAQKLANLGSWMMARIKMLFVLIFNRLLLLLWQVSYYFVLMYAILYKIVLIIIGPISFAISILPWFSTTWQYWVAHYIKASLYGVMAQVVFLVSTLPQTYALQVDNLAMQKVLQGDSLTGCLAFAGSLGSQAEAYEISLCMGIIGMFCVPTMVNWVVQVGTSSLGDGIKSGVSSVAQTVATIAK